jgi:hypothetical protein
MLARRAADADSQRNQLEEKRTIGRQSLALQEFAQENVLRLPVCCGGNVSSWSGRSNSTPPSAPPPQLLRVRSLAFPLHSSDDIPHQAHTDWLAPNRPHTVSVHVELHLTAAITPFTHFRPSGSKRLDDAGYADRRLKVSDVARVTEGRYLDAIQPVSSPEAAVVPKERQEVRHGAAVDEPSDTQWRGSASWSLNPWPTFLGAHPHYSECAAQAESSPVSPRCLASSLPGGFALHARCALWWWKCPM